MNWFWVVVCIVIALLWLFDGRLDMAGVWLMFSSVWLRFALVEHFRSQSK